MNVMRVVHASQSIRIARVLPGERCAPVRYGNVCCPTLHRQRNRHAAEIAVDRRVNQNIKCRSARFTSG